MMNEWKRSLKRIFVLALSVILIGNSVDLSGLMVSAESSQVQESVSDGDSESVSGGNVSGGDDALIWEEVTGSYVPDMEFPSNEELFAGYVDKMFYGGVNFFAIGGNTAGSKLTGDEKLAYDALVPLIKSVASGERASTEFTIGQGDGVNYLVDVEVTFTEPTASFDSSVLIYSLMMDLPYEMYWYDKTKGITIAAWSQPDGTLLRLELSFKVAKDYQLTGEDVSTVVTDITKTAATTNAVNTAKAIVTANEGKTDYEKLVAYRDAICDATDYNYDALSVDVSYGDPWQLVYVFDGNADTKVVCEGYSKAFQYLCDMSDFTEDIACYIATGDMNAGGHMWNIVTMDDGLNYMVDITNSDEGSVGQNGGLFLSGVEGSIASGYTFNIGVQSVKFTYDSDCTALWGTGDTSILKLAASDYEKQADYVAKVSINGTETFYNTFVEAYDAAGDGATLTLLKDATVPDDACNTTNAFEIEKNLTLDLNSKTLDLGGNRLYFDNNHSYTIGNGKIQSSNDICAVQNYGTMVLDDVSISSTGQYGVTSVGTTSASSKLTLIGGDIYGNKPISVATGQLVLKENPELKYDGVYKNFITLENPKSSIIVAEEIAEGNYYSIFNNSTGRQSIKNAVCAEDGITLKEEWFECCGLGYEMVFDSEGNTISILCDLQDAMSLSFSTAEYTGVAQTPEVVVKYNGVTLTNGEDYSISYEKDGQQVAEMKEVGVYDIVLTGIGDYTGVDRENFEITKAEITSVDVSVAEPEAKELAQNEIESGEFYTGTISWSPADTTFGFNTVYKATIVLTADGNHQFTESTTYGDFDTAVVSTDVNGNSTLTLTKSYEATRKEKINSVSVPVSCKLDTLYSTADEVIAQLPSVVSCTTETTRTVEFSLKWSVSGDFNASQNAQNAFLYAIDDADWANYETIGMVVGGSITVENASGLAVNNVGKNDEITYDGNTYDVSKLFTIDGNAGAPSYSLVESYDANAGKGTLSGTTLTITKAGKITIKLTTAVNGDYAAAETTAVLTVNKGEGTANAWVDDVVFGETVTVFYSFAGQEGMYKGAQYFEGTENSGASYSSEERPKNAGNYTATLIIEGGDLYKDKTITDDFTIKKAVPEITEIGASKTLYESTLVSEVVLVADSVSTPGSLTLDGVTELKLGTNEYAYKFTPDDTNNYEVVSGKVSLTVLANSLEKLEISGALNKSVYTYGEDFELAGVTVTATYADSTIKDVTSQVTYEKALVAGQTEVVLTYQGKTCKVSGIIVNKKRLDTADVNWVYEAYTYDGKEKSVTLSDNLAEGIVVTYTGNKAVDAGTYKAKAELKLAEGYSSDNYEIEIAPHISGEFEWRINPMTMDDTNTVYVLGDSLTYNGKEQTQEVKSVKCNGLQVTFNVSNNKGTNATDYVMVVTGNGNFEGSVDIPWSIAKKNISDAVVTLGEALTYNGATQTQSISSISTDGMTMTTTDYVVTGDAALNAGDYTLTVTAAENSNFTGSATAKWSIAKKDITGVEVTLGEALTYNGVEQTLDYTVGKVDGLTITYDASGYKATNAGDYEVIITANGNFTGTAKKAWSIAPKDITGAQVVLGSALTYNGSEQTQGVSSVTVDGLTLKAADYELTGNKATDAGDYTLTIKGKDNFTGTVTKGYTVAKAEAPAIADVEKYYVYSAGSSDQTVSIDLAALLPEKIGAAGYTLAENAAAYMLEETVSTDGKLTYKVAATANAGDTTTLTVTVTSKNYEDIRIKVVIKITDKFITTLMAGTEVTVKGTNELIYGQKLSDLTLDGTTAVFVADGTTDVVEGTLSWVAPDTVFTAGEATPQWKFVPKDTASYTELSGNVTITVKKAVPVVTLPAVGVSIYNPEKTLADVTLVGTKGSHTVAGSKVDVDGTWSFKDGTIVPTVKNNGYTVVFTPVDTNNYEAVEKTVAVEVAKATPVVDVKPEAAQITYGQTLADAAFTGGKAAYAEGSNIAVDGSFAWKDATMAPVVADSETTEYAVVFTPADADNYNTVTFMMTVKVAKAQNAPNMPVETLRAAHTVTTVGQISLPVDWKWAEEDADIQLETGVPETATAVYVGADAGNYLVEAVDITITRAAAPQKPAVTTPSYGTPYIQGDFSKSGWEMIRVVVTGTKIGETVNVEMNGAKVVPGDVFNDIKSKDITLVFHMEGGLSWTVTGLSVTADKVSDLNLGISSGSSTIPVNVVNRVTGERYSMNISLDYSGEFGLTAILNVNVKTENEGRFANLFYYNPAYGSMQFVCADEINELGMAHLPFTHASEYVIVIDDTIMNKVFSSPKTGDGDMAWNYWWMLVLAAFAVSGGYAVNKKKRR